MNRLCMKLAAEEKGEKKFRDFAAARYAEAKRILSFRQREENGGVLQGKSKFIRQIAKYTWRGRAFVSEREFAE